jgi:hypothetical protein
VAAAVCAAVLVCLSVCASALAVGDINRETCEAFPETEASPGFRSSLPDCRAFELVSPSYGAGSIAEGIENHAPPISPEGEHLLAISFGAFAEAEELGQDGTETGEVYEFSRTPTGWVTEPQDPPASLYPLRFLAGWSTSDLARSVWLVPGPLPSGAEPERAWLRKNNSLYVLREGRGRFAVVGPAVAPGHEVSAEPKFSFIDGVSANVSHIEFTVLDERQQLWPGDSTVEGRSLYEYAGTGGGEPVLVGVSNLGALHGSPHVNEGAQLVSECGTEYDGMSAGGERVFFTAQHVTGCAGSQPGVNELYARVEGSHTVAISEPSMSIPGRECTGVCREDQEDPAKRSAGTFQGASEDGAKIFFTSEQPLVNSAVGGGSYLYEETITGDGLESHVGSLTLLAPGVTDVARVSSDGTRVYFKSTSILPTTANANGETASDVSGEKLYVYDTESPTTSFVASGEGANAFDATADGQFIVFSSTVDLRGTDDSSKVPQLFEYDAATEALVRVSVGQRTPGGYECATTGEVQEGYNCDGNTTVGEDAPRLVQGAVDSVAADGTVVFSSELALTPQAVPGRTLRREAGETLSYAENVYEYRAGQVYLISPGDEAMPAHFQAAEEQTRLKGIDESGRDIFFSSVDNLVPQDTDTQSSWYDAREGGGFPGPLTQTECAGEACQGPVGVAPPLPGVGGSAVTAPGENVSPPASTGSSTVVKPKAPETKAEKLAKALKVCKSKRQKRKRAACEKSTRARYGPARKAKKSDRGHRS